MSMRLFPVHDEPTDGVDARALLILHNHLPNIFTVEGVFYDMCGECAKSCDKTEDEHEVQVGLGEQQHISSFGKLFFVCKSDYRMNVPLKDVEIPIAEFSEMIDKILRLDPPAILGKELRAKNMANWNSLRYRPSRNSIRLGQGADAQTRDGAGSQSSVTDNLAAWTPAPSNRTSPTRNGAASLRTLRTTRSPAKHTTPAVELTPPPPNQAVSTVKKKQPRPRPAYLGARKAVAASVFDGGDSDSGEDALSESSSLPSEGTVRRELFGKYALQAKKKNPETGGSGSTPRASRVPQRTITPHASQSKKVGTASIVNAPVHKRPAEHIEITSSEPEANDSVVEDAPVKAPTHLTKKRKTATPARSARSNAAITPPDPPRVSKPLVCSGRQTRGAKALSK